MAVRPTYYFVRIIFLPVCFWATICKTVLPMLSDRCLSVLSVSDVGVLWPSGWMNQDKTWHGGRPRPRPECFRWGPNFPSPKGAQPQFLAHVRWGQTAGCIKMPLGRKVDLGPGNIVLDGDPARPQRRGAQYPQFWPACCGQTAAWIKLPLGTGVGLCPGHIVFIHEDPAPP